MEVGVEISMMEQLMPEVTMYALSFLDYQSLCPLSMTNSLMHSIANGEIAWKTLYLKDFTPEQGNVKPANGWKAYYGATIAIVNINAEFFRIVKGRSHTAMSLFWLNAGYVKCLHATGQSFTGYNEVMESWRAAFRWENVTDFQLRDVRTRVLTDMYWLTMKAFADVEKAYNVTNIYELYNGRWYMVHHHSLAALIDGGADQQFVQGLRDHNCKEFQGNETKKKMQLLGWWSSLGRMYLDRCTNDVGAKFIL